MLTPDEVRVKEFLPSMRGYDADEVRAFLLAIADTMQELQDVVDRGAAVAAAAPAAPPAPVADPHLTSKVTRLSEELEVAIWTMRRLESAVERLEERLDSGPAQSFLAS